MINDTFSTIKIMIYGGLKGEDYIYFFKQTQRKCHRQIRGMTRMSLRMLKNFIFKIELKLFNPLHQILILVIREDMWEPEKLNITD